MKKKVYKKVAPKLRFFTKKKKATSAQKNKKTLEFPNILRTFTEKHFFALVISLFLLTAVIFSGFNLYKSNSQKQEVDKERWEIIKEVTFWKSVVAKYSDYRDAYFQLAILHYRLGDFVSSKFYLEKTLDIDPNFEKGRELEEILIPK